MNLIVTADGTKKSGNFATNCNIVTDHPIAPTVQFQVNVHIQSEVTFTPTILQSTGSMADNIVAPFVVTAKRSTAEKLEVLDVFEMLRACGGFQRPRR